MLVGALQVRKVCAASLVNYCEAGWRAAVPWVWGRWPLRAPAVWDLGSG